MTIRLNALPDNQLASMIRDIFTDYNTLKVSGQLLGSDSVVIHANKSGNTYDINQAVAAYTVATWRIVFTPSVMKSPFAELTYSYGVSGGTGGELAWFVPDPAYTTSGQLAWDFGFESWDNACTVNVIFAIKCPDTGTFTVTRTS